MDQVMNILMTIFSPMIFWPIIGVICFVFILVVIFSGLADKKTTEQDLGSQKKLVELEQASSDREAKLAELEERFRAKEVDYNRQLTRLEEQISENETSKTRIKSLEAQLKEREDSAAKVSSSQAEVDKKTQSLQAEVEKVKKELSLKQEMYSGLKGQYEELEAQIAANSKKYTDELEKNKKLQDEINELKDKLDGARKESSQVIRSVSAPSPIVQVKKEVEAVEKKSEPPIIISKKEEPKVSAPIVEKPVLPAQIKPVEPAGQPPVQGQASPKLELPKKPKPPGKPEAKVRLAQVMQEAAKVGGKKEEKTPTADKDKTQQKEPSPTSPEQAKQNPPLPPGAAPS